MSVAVDVLFIVVLHVAIVANNLEMWLCYLNERSHCRISTRENSNKCFRKFSTVVKIHFIVMLVELTSIDPVYPQGSILLNVIKKKQS